MSALLRGLASVLVAAAIFDCVGAAFCFADGSWGLMLLDICAAVFALGCAFHCAELAED